MHGVASFKLILQARRLLTARHRPVVFFIELLGFIFQDISHEHTMENIDLLLLSNVIFQ